MTRSGWNFQDFLLFFLSLSGAGKPYGYEVSGFHRDNPKIVTLAVKKPRVNTRHGGIGGMGEFLRRSRPEEAALVSRSPGPLVTLSPCLPLVPLSPCPPYPPVPLSPLPLPHAQFPMPHAQFPIP
ncbi:MAG: hypothetical protein F6J93_08450 [Oscillatoria sp. SIO1A7]|nr:hypothetical protein [Oscillatoria sp. SIO1A7]